MNAVVTLSAILMALVGPAAATAQSREQILLTAGVVKSVDLEAQLIVLENGRKLRPRAILLDGEWVDLSTVQPKDSIVLSGIDLGREEARASVLPRRR
jgi:hypothetical protein